MITWDEIKSKNIPLDEIKEDSPEYEAMKSAAENGNKFAQHAMGLWNETVALDNDEAKKWYKKAADQGHEGAKQAFSELVDIRKKAALVDAEHD